MNFKSICKNISNKKIGLFGIVIAVVSVVVAVLQYKADKVSLSQAEIEQKRQGLYKLGDFAKTFAGLTERTNRDNAKEVIDSRNYSDLDVDNPPVPVGLIISKNETDMLCIEAQNLQNQINPVSSFRINKLIDNLCSAICGPGLLFTELNLKDGNISYEKKSGYLKEQVSQLSNLISTSYVLLNKEINEGMPTQKYFKNKYSYFFPEKIILIDLKKLNPGIDITIQQNYNLLLDNSNKNLLKLYMFPTEDNYGVELTEAKKIDSTIYQFEHDQLSGSHFVILALLDELKNINGEAIIGDRGVFVGDEFKGWAFTPPNFNLEKFGNQWYAKWK